VIKILAIIDKMMQTEAGKSIAEKYTTNEQTRPTIHPIKGKYRVALLIYSSEWFIQLGQGMRV